MEHKQAKLRSLLDNREKMQKEAAVDAPTPTSVQDILSLLANVGHGNASASGGGKDEESSSDSSSSSSDSDAEHPADEAAGSATKSRLEGMFGGIQKRTTSGSAGSVAGSVHGDNARAKPATSAAASAKSSGGSKKLGSAPRAQWPVLKPVGKNVIKGDAKPPLAEPVNMDGRCKRLQESLEKLARDGESDLCKLKEFLQDEDKFVWDDPTSREQTKKEAAIIKRECGKIVAAQKIAVRRFDSSSASGKSAATDAKKHLDLNIEAGQQLQTFVDLLLMPQPPLDDFMNTMNAVSSQGVRFTKGLYKYAYWVKLNGLMVFERHDEMCKMATWALTGPGHDASGEGDLQKLIDCDMPREEVLSYASLVLQQCISESINSLTESQVGRPLSEYPKKKDVHAMLVKINKYCTVDGFAGCDAQASIEKWILVLDLEHADPHRLSEFAAHYEANPKEAAEMVSPTDILGQLLYTTSLGTRLLDSAVAMAKDEASMLEVVRCINKVDSLMESLLQEEPSMAELEDDDSVVDADYIQYMNKHVVPIETLIQEVFAHASVSDKATLKQKQEAIVVDKETFGSPNRFVGLCPERVRFVCKRVHPLCP